VCHPELIRGTRAGLTDGFLVHRTPSADRVATGCATRGRLLTATPCWCGGAADGETCLGRLDSNSLGVAYTMRGGVKMTRKAAEPSRTVPRSTGARSRIFDRVTLSGPTRQGTPHSLDHVGYPARPLRDRSLRTPGGRVGPGPATILGYHSNLGQRRSMPFNPSHSQEYSWRLTPMRSWLASTVVSAF
jgi:hypothetical protein